jgi:hypothetical protein
MYNRTGKIAVKFAFRYLRRRYRRPPKAKRARPASSLAGYRQLAGLLGSAR